MKIIKENNKDYISCKNLHRKLGIKENMSTWFNHNQKKAKYLDGIDYIKIIKKSTGGRPCFDYLITDSTAISLIARAGKYINREVQLEIEELFSEKTMTLTSTQTEALTSFIEAMK